MLNQQKTSPPTKSGVLEVLDQPPTTHKQEVTKTHNNQRLETDCSGNCSIYGFVQDWSISSALAMEILQSCTKPTIYWPGSPPPLFKRYTSVRNYIIIV